MDKDKLKSLVAEKMEAALKSSVHPKKFFVTENGRGVVDGGDLYNAVLKDVLQVVQVALVDIIEETLSAKVQAAPSEPKVAAIKPVPQNDAKVSTAKNSSQKDKKR